MGKDFKVKVFDGNERAETFMKVFGRTEVCVVSPIPVLIGVPGFDEPQRAYLLDLKEISRDERARMIAHISEKFGLEAAEVDSLLDSRGMPILASECVLTIENPQRWIDFDDERPGGDSVEDLYDDDDDYFYED